jgi:hypothetical protein
LLIQPKVSIKDKKIKSPAQVIEWQPPKEQEEIAEEKIRKSLDI